MNYSREEMVKSVPSTGFFGHPRGLGVLFFIEFWERFSYYGMRAILLYFMYDSVANGGLGLAETTAQSIMSLYGALIFMTCIIGGWLADRVFGSRTTLFYGAVLIMLGHIFLALPFGGLVTFLASMLFIIIGTGMLKPNISNVVGGLYDKNDTRMDNGFVIFYMSVNMGAFISPLIVGNLQTSFGYHAGFSAAAFGMFLALIFYVIFNKKNLGLVGKDIPNPLEANEKARFKKNLLIVFAIIVILLVIGYFTNLLTFNVFSLVVTGLGIFLPFIYFLSMYSSKKTTAVEKSRLLSYIPLFLSAVMFWAIQEQGSSILSAFIDKNTQRDLNPLLNIDYTIPAAFFQSINPLLIVLFAPIISGFWQKLGNLAPATPIKFALGLFLAGISFLMMVIPTMGMGSETLINPLWIVFSFAICVIGELCLSPVGSSVSVKLAPKAFESQMMSLWLLSSATAQGVNAQLVRLYGIMSKSTYFGFLGAIAIALAVIVFVLTPWMSKKMQGIK